MRRLREGLWRVVENRQGPVRVAWGDISESGRRAERLREPDRHAGPNRNAVAEAVVRMQHGVRMGRGPRCPEGLRRRRRNHRTDIHVQRARIDGCQVHGDPGKQHDRDEAKQAAMVHVGS